ncbi:hypothetical protein [Methylorubrum suomiense]|uniref:Uncharacterized protein n=1 Tax=Methylorubrum suomiense TaxID=144191 RepID=A0ABQ4V044_9HYPH|nr:hypothetical protein [Methylorubrum suomiense]GJE77743.1 hypothetical protein BGCPKDLD_4350 [Methylorubrum suomiense]
MYAATSAAGQSLTSKMGEANAVSVARIGEAARPTLQRAIENAHRVGGRLDETGARLAAMAEVAEQMATRLCGSYPTEGPNKVASNGPSERGPLSTVEAIDAAIDGLHPRITGFESPLNRIARAFEMIEAANG